MVKASKTQRQENFPVAAFFFSAPLRQTITDYYNFARFCDDIADSKTLSKKQKLQRLNDAEKVLLTGDGSLYPAQRLRETFLAEKLNFSLATDLLTAFRRDAENIKYETWGQLLDYCKYSAAPVGRFMLALHDENPSTYLPATALCSVLQITNHIQDLKDDAAMLKRIYLPKELLGQHKVKLKDLTAENCSKNLKFLINDVLLRCDGLLKDARILPEIIKSRRLKFYTAVTLSLTDSLIAKLKAGDVLSKKIRLGIWDKLRAFCHGMAVLLTVRRKTLTNKGL